MRPYSLDTSFLIDVLDSEASARETMERLDESDRPLGVTPIAAAELSVGANLGTAAERRRADELLDSLLWLDVPRRAARRAGEMQATLKRAGEPIPFTDCLIAGATEHHDGTLVTSDADFERLDSLDVLVY
ncbi:MAG: PIN domain-containing protein [Halorientalis sp.]